MDLTVSKTDKQCLNNTDSGLQSASPPPNYRHKSAYSIDSLLGDIVNRHRPVSNDAGPATSTTAATEALLRPQERHDVDVVDVNVDGNCSVLSLAVCNYTYTCNTPCHLFYLSLFCKCMLAI